MKTAILFLSLITGTAFGATSQAGGSGNVSGSTQVAPTTQPSSITRRNALLPAVTASNQFSQVSSNFVSSNQFGMNSNQLQSSNNLSATGAASGTNPFNNNIVSRDRAVTENDQALLIALRQRVQNQLGVTTVGALPVHFFINNGVVTIIGVVPSAAENQRILLTAQQTPGVTQVDNRLRIGTVPLAPEPQNPHFVGATTDHAFSPADQSVLMSIHQRIAAQLNIDSSAFATLPIHISIQNGVVGLTGRIGTAQQKQQLLAAVQSTPGVTRVVDNLQLGAEPAFLESTNAPQ